MLEPIPDGIGDHGIGNDLRPVVQRELGSEHGRLADRTLFQYFA